VRFGLRIDVPGPPGRLGVRAALFPYDPNHQTFVNVYEHGTLTHQSILDRRLTAIDYFTGTRQGTVAVVRKFVPAGVHHILIGPDHVLFLIGLLLLGGRMLQLVKIVTAFTLAHSVTLSLAALDLVNPSARLVEPSIALSIAYVGADNLLVSRDGRDVRAWIAFGFGLVHGFGFASVLKALDLPRRALGWSLFSFNVGVEIGQVLIVIIIAGALAWVARTKPALSRPIAVAGSVVVAAAGVYWFVERVFLTGGPS
jgi:hydrogenase/urease accessory protein HupE